MPTASPGQPTCLEHLRNFHLHQVKGYSSKAAPGLATFGKAELGSGILVPSPFSAELAACGCTAPQPAGAVGWPRSCENTQFPI